jgi:hypothetical protein
MYVCYFPQTFVPSPKTVFNFDFIPKIVCQETGRIVIPARPDMFPSPPPPVLPPVVLPPVLPPVVLPPVVLPPVVRSTPSPPPVVVSAPSPPFEDKLLSIPIAQKEPIPKIGTIPPPILPPVVPLVLPPAPVVPPPSPPPPPVVLPPVAPAPPVVRSRLARLSRAVAVHLTPV